MKIAIWLAAAIALLGAHQTRGQDHMHPPQDAQLHEQFYKTWNKPNVRNDKDERTQSCCNLVDCYPTTIKKINGDWLYLHRETQTWKTIPPYILEHNQSDPRESPDGGSHVCATATGVLYCATLGSAG